MRQKAPALLAFLAGTVLAAGESAAAPMLAPHRAVYDLSLDTASDRSGINDISGRMVYEFAGSECEGYTVNFRFVTRIATDETSRTTDQQTTTFEAADGESFDFVTRSFVDETLDRKLKGTATSKPTGTTVELEEPEPKTYELERTLFPTEHLIELLGKAEAGESFYQTTLFDGSDDADRVMMTTVVLGDPKAPAAGDPEREAMDEIASDPFWPVTIAYFDGAETGGEETPDYNISFKLHENGVTRDLTMNYGEFSIEGRLVDLAVSETANDCAE